MLACQTIVKPSQIYKNKNKKNFNDIVKSDSSFNKKVSNDQSVSVAQIGSRQSQ